MRCKQADGVGHGDIDVGLLHSVAKTGIKQLDFSGDRLLHLSLILSRCRMHCDRRVTICLRARIEPFRQDNPALWCDLRGAIRGGNEEAISRVRNGLRLLTNLPNFPSAAKARPYFVALTARLKPCPFKAETSWWKRRGHFAGAKWPLLVRASDARRRRGYLAATSGWVVSLPSL